MTCKELRRSLRKILDKTGAYRLRDGVYYLDKQAHDYIKQITIKEMLISLCNWVDCNGIEELPRKIKLDTSIKRKHIVSVFAEAGLKVTRYTREYGKTIVYFEPISDSQ